MSRLRRFRHLEGARPRRDDAEARTRLGRFAAVGAPAAALACARCGDPLPDADASCPRCATDDAPAPEASGRTERFRTLAGTGSIPLAREVAPRATGSEVASTVPAWRGEAFPDDVAAEVRQKLAGLPPQVDRSEQALRWAEEELARERRERAFLLAAAILGGRSAFGASVRGVGAIVVLSLAWLFSRGCS